MKRNTSIVRIFGSIALLTAASMAQAAQAPSDTNREKERHRHEATGVFSGAVVGALVAGPAGAIITAGLGGWIGDMTFAKKNNAQLNETLKERDQELLSMQAEYRAMQARYEIAAREAQAVRLRNASFETQASPASTLADCCSDSEISLHFKTNSITVESLYDEKLSEFAALVNDLPDAVIEITGHSDRRGGSSANLALSQQRIQAVEKKLLALGVRNTALQTSAFGESRPLTSTDTLENNFFDRRVVLKVISAGNGYLTRTED